MEKSLRGLLPEEMLTDHLGIDIQHEEIFARIESLRNGDMEAAGHFINQLSGLLDYLAAHFAQEEQLAAAAGLEFSGHAKTHAQNLRLLHKGMDEVKRGSMEACSFLRFLDYWFEHHINEFDKPFARRLQIVSGTTRNGNWSALRLSA